MVAGVGKLPEKLGGLLLLLLIPGLHSRAAEMESRNLDLGDQAR